MALHLSKVNRGFVDGKGVLDACQHGVCELAQVGDEALTFADSGGGGMDDFLEAEGAFLNEAYDGGEEHS